SLIKTEILFRHVFPLFKRNHHPERFPERLVLFPEQIPEAFPSPCDCYADLFSTIPYHRNEKRFFFTRTLTKKNLVAREYSPRLVTCDLSRFLYQFFERNIRIRFGSLSPISPVELIIVIK